MSTDEQALEDEWEEEVEAQPPDKCPACGGSRFGIYVMGMPMTGGDFFEQLDRDEIRLLGCIPSDNDPFWFCRDCDADILEACSHFALPRVTSGVEWDSERRLHPISGEASQPRNSQIGVTPKDCHTLSIMEEVAEGLHETTELPVGESTSRQGSPP